MRPLSLVPLLALPLLLGAVCVTKVDQKGPAGPWIGEVVNTGPDIQSNVFVEGEIQDANGNLIKPTSDMACPVTLAPGDKGYLMMTVGPSVVSLSDFVQPFHLSVKHVNHIGLIAPPVRGVTLNALETFPDHNGILVELRNDSANIYRTIRVCGIHFASSGEVVEIAGSGLFQEVVRPGDVVVFPMRFDSPLDGTFQFGVEQLGFGSSDTFVASPPFNYSTRIVRTAEGRSLQVIGEVTNTSGNDLRDARFQAYLESSPTIRKQGSVGTMVGADSITYEGNGFIPAGAKALVAFSLPLDDDDSTVVEIVGLVAQTLDYRLSPVSVTSIAIKRTKPSTIKVSAKLQNPAGEGLIVDSLCFYLRDAAGKLVGGQCGSVAWVAPRDSLVVSQNVTWVGPHRPSSVEAVAYGHPGPEPTETP